MSPPCVAYSGSGIAGIRPQCTFFSQELTSQ